MVNRLEDALWRVAGPIRETRFAKVLQNARRAEPDPSMPHPDGRISAWELSFDPAIQRSSAATSALAIETRSAPIDSEWSRWNEAALKAMARIAAKCWAGIDREQRMVFLDEDNFHPIWNQTNVHNLRSDESGPWLKFEGLNQPTVAAALGQVYNAARATPAYAQAKEASGRLGRSRTLLLVWAQLAQRGHAELNKALQESPIGEGRERGDAILRELYAATSVEALAVAFQRYNRLVQQIVWTILGLAEVVPGPVVIGDVVGTVRCTIDDAEGPFVRLTSTNAAAAFLRLTHPVQIAMGLPLDGTYNLVGYTMTLAPDAASDFSLVPLGWAAGQWPPSPLPGSGQASEV